jgi:hypothetical protein
MRSRLSFKIWLAEGCIGRIYFLGRLRDLVTKKLKTEDRAYSFWRSERLCDLVDRYLYSGSKMSQELKAAVLISIESYAMWRMKGK